MKFVPYSCDPCVRKIEQFSHYIRSCQKLLILTGAGISTESGIPDYRSEGVGLYASKNHKPMQYQVFIKSADARQRYWAQNFVAWPIFSSIQPNKVHKSLANWEHLNKLYYLVTQNVDNLHLKAGSNKVVELHGSTYRVICTSCIFTQQRKEFQNVLKNMNTDFKTDVKSSDMNPDGDIAVLPEFISRFKYPDCPNCGGILKPDIIFFGDNLPAERRDFVKDLVENCDGLLCLGTTMEVYSSYRIAKQAHNNKIPICIVNIGTTRADNLANYKLNGRLGFIFPILNYHVLK